MPPARPDLTGLESLARDPRLDVTPVLLRVQTDLFVTASNRDRTTIAALEALVSGLLPKVDDATAARVARKLAPCPDTPATLIDLLARRGGEVRRAVIERACRLPGWLRDAALEAEGDEAEALAGRPDLDGDTVLRLADRGEDAFDFALAMNRRVALDGDTLDILVARARSRPALANALLARGDLGAFDEAALYLHADMPRRAAIRERLSASALPRPLPRMTGAPDLAVVARVGDRAEFEQALAERLGLDALPDFDIERPHQQELLALALVAAGVPAEDCIAIFLTLTPAISHSVAAVFALAETARTVPAPVATALVAAILGTPLGARGTGRHLPAAHPSGTPARGSAVMSVERRSGDAQIRPRRAG